MKVLKADSRMSKGRNPSTMMADAFESRFQYEPEPQSTPSSPAPQLEGGVREVGKTVIADIVLAKIAGTALAESRGIHVLQNTDGSPCSAPHALADDPSCGVDVEATDGINVTVRLVVDYGTPIGELADKLRGEIALRMQRLTGMAVREVNIHVNDVFFHEPGSEDPLVGNNLAANEQTSDRSASRYPGILTGRASDQDE